MKKTLHLFVFCCLLLSSITISAKEIPVEAAERLVSTVIQRNAGPALKNSRSMRIKERFTKEVAGKANFHIFNLSPTGFVIIAGDDRYNAVLAFSDESNINLNSQEEYIGLWGTLSYHEERIQYIRANNLEATTAVKNEWSTLRNREVSTARNYGVVVAPLTTTKWNQGTYYNAECPANEETAETGPDGRTYCGCGPIAMAQLIKFHNSPVTGNGSNSYVDPIYGEQRADFCSTDYNWENMPDELTAPNADVAKLIYHMGVSTYTYYSTDYTETYLSYMRDAFVNNFGFDQSANWFYDANGDFNWVARNDLDRGRPLLLSGVSVFGGAHTWVADGYGYFDASGGAGEAEYFHFNWGWGGDNNGWFLDTDESWFPRGDEPDNVEITYYFDRYVVQNLLPAPDGCQAPESIYANGAENDGVYLNVYYSSGKQDISFRYRKLGTTEWTETATTDNFFFRATGLELTSEYEFQARRKCCPNDWSPYTESQNFATAGFVPCTPLAASGLSADAISDHNAYIYTVQPFGAVINQFRYRPVGTTDWLFTDNANTHYRYLSDLLAGTEYEIQVSQQCSNGDFTQFSGSYNFTTTGEATDGEGNGSTDETPTNSDCLAINASDLTTSSITESYAYIYTPQSFGAIDNQFRYRPVGTNDWTTTDISTLYYRFLGDLTAGTTYEFQVRQACSADSWSNYSSSSEFTTTGDAPADTGSGTDENDGGNTNDGTGEGSGNSDCPTINASDLTTSSITDSYAYIYTSQPLGTIDNQFRFRPVGTSNWATTDISTLYYRFLGDLSAGTTYEFQVRQACSADSWSNYSASSEFTTTGEASTDMGGGTDENDGGNTDVGTGDNTGDGGNSDGDEEGSEGSNCITISANEFFTSSTGNNNSYIYTPQPLGAVNNQFRYRPIGASEWLITDVSTLYYRYLSDLTAGTDYEFEVRHECSAGTWSTYAGQGYFTTTGGSANNSKVGNVLPLPLTQSELAAINPTAYANSKIAERKLTLFPNPTRTELTITLDSPLKENSFVRVYDRMGRYLKGVTFSAEITTIRLNVSDLAAGVYLIQMEIEDNIRTKRFLVL